MSDPERPWESSAALLCDARRLFAFPKILKHFLEYTVVGGWPQFLPPACPAACHEPGALRRRY